MAELASTFQHQKTGRSSCLVSYYLDFGRGRKNRSILLAPEVILGLLQWCYSSAIKKPRAPPFIAPPISAAHRTPQDGRPSGIPPDLPLCLCSSHSHCHPAGQCQKKKRTFLGRFCGVRNASDDDELIVRASAVLKSQGPENWSRGSQWETRSSLGAYKLALCSGRISRENPGENRWWGSVVWRHRSGVLVLFFSVCKWREGPVTVHRGSVFVWASAPTFAR